MVHAVPQKDSPALRGHLMGSAAPAAGSVVLRMVIVRLGGMSCRHLIASLLLTSLQPEELRNVQVILR